MQNTLNELNSLVMHTPWRALDFLILFGNFLQIFIAVWMVLSFFVQLRRLLRRSGKSAIQHVDRTNALCLVLGWVGLLIGLFLTWRGLYVTWTEYAKMVGKGEVFAIINYRDDIFPCMIGCVLWIFSQMQSALIGLVRKHHEIREAEKAGSGRS